MTSSELQHCDTELGLGRPAPPRCASEEKATAVPCDGDRQPCGGSVTELQAMAIVRMARRAAAEEGRARPSGRGADGRLSMRRSLEWFLLRRREAARRRHGVAASSPSSSSCCLTYS